MTRQQHFIKEWRKHRGLTQLALAQRMNIGRSYLTMIESGSRRYDQDFLENAATALDCSPADLISRPPGQRESIDALLDSLDDAERVRVEAVVRAMIHPDEMNGH